MGTHDWEGSTKKNSLCPLVDCFSSSEVTFMGSTPASVEKRRTTEMRFVAAAILCWLKKNYSNRTKNIRVWKTPLNQLSQNRCHSLWKFLIRVNPFCCTSLPLTSTRWVGSTTRLCTVHSLRSSLLINLGTPRIEPRDAGWEAKMLSTVLCGPPNGSIFSFVFLIFVVSINGAPSMQGGVSRPRC